MKSKSVTHSGMTGPLAAAGGGTSAVQPGETENIADPLGPVLDTPFVGALQPIVGTDAIDQDPRLEQASLETPGNDIPSSPRPYSRRRLVGVGLLGFGLLAVIVLGIRIELNKGNTQNSLLSANQKVRSQSTSLTGLSSELGSTQEVSTLTVNGKLDVSNAVILQPSVLSGPAVTGEMYYDSTTDTLAYYNGKRFVHLQEGGNTYVTNNTAGSTYNTFITNASGGGLGINGTPGTLALFAPNGTAIQSSIASQSGSSLLVAGYLTLKAGNDSATSFQIQKANGNGLLTADTANNAIVIGNDGSPTNVALRAGAASGNNLTGADLTIQASNGTGSATSGDIIFETGVSAENGIEFDAATETHAGYGDIAVNENLTVGSQSNRILIASFDCGAASMSYDGRPLTKLGSQNGGGNDGSSAYIEMWYLVAPPSGAHVLTATFSSLSSAEACEGSGSGTLGAASYYNVDQTIPLGQEASATGTVPINQGTGTTGLTVAISNSSQVVVDALATNLGTQSCASAVNPGQTLRWTSGRFKYVCGSDQAAIGSSMDISYEIEAADWSDIAVPLNPAVPQSIPLFIASATTPDALYNRLDITAGGNVGVDNANPQYALDVTGIINASTVMYTPALDTNDPGILTIGQYDATGIQLGNVASNIPISLLGATIIKPTAGNDSMTELQIQNSSGVPLLTADTANMKITITNLVASASLTIDGHIVTGGGTPTITAGTAAACGGTATAALSGNDTSGTITVTTGAGACSSTGDLAVISFNGVYGSMPRISLTPIGLTTEQIGDYADSPSMTGFNVGGANTPTPSTTYMWDYQVVQ